MTQNTLRAKNPTRHIQTSKSYTSTSTKGHVLGPLASNSLKEIKTVVDRGPDWRIEKLVTVDMTARTETSRKFVLTQKTVVQESLTMGTPVETVVPGDTAGTIETTKDVVTEFTSLGEARGAAGKTIQHPEKLTVSKADVWAKIKKK